MPGVGISIWLLLRRTLDRSILFSTAQAQYQNEQACVMKLFEAIKFTY